ncbi:hypothetical protein PV327_008134 [Microctonus hyperodae]|uniref:BTB domain-containing protein n=1 Tax=Microctonus hyperodae TaxID=165561 RepID=A0AA39F2I4_MICHY|nr:hypothetical protein PV327_008134 [Microctonus hyperodae]
MSQKEIRIKHEWQLDYNVKKTFGCTSGIKMEYSNSFESDLIPNVEFEIFCCISSNEKCYVVLSKTPYEPVNATIVIEFKERKISVQRYVDCWLDTYTQKFEFQNILQDVRQHYISSAIHFQCHILWHANSDEPKPQELNGLCKRFENFFNLPDLKDATIVIDEKEIPVHKIILAAHSPVFLAMFKADMTESVNKIIVINDIDFDIIKKVIRFIYTGVLDPTLDVNALLSILEVANKYEIMSLKKLCEERLIEDMTTDNVLKILERASLYGVPQMMETLTSFMVKKKLQIVALEDFADLYCRKPELLLEFIICSIATQD